MRKWFCLALGGLLTSLAVQATGAAEPEKSARSEKEDKVCTADTCGKYGTSVEFVATPSDAARQALKEQKLVFVLHVSGLFEDPKFT